MGTLEQLQQLAEKLNTYGLRFKDVWLAHLQLRFEAIEVERYWKYTSAGPMGLFGGSELVAMYGIHCLIEGSLYVFKPIRLYYPMDNPLWNDPEGIREDLEGLFDEGYKLYYDIERNGKYGPSYAPPLAGMVKLDYDHHCAVAAAQLNQAEQK